MIGLEPGHGGHHVYVRAGEFSPHTMPTRLDHGHGGPHAYVQVPVDSRTASTHEPVYYHGTFVDDPGHILPASNHGKHLVYPEESDPTYAYATKDRDAAWDYATDSYASAVESGIAEGRRPRVYRVRPLHNDHSHVEIDPNHDETTGRRRDTNPGDRRSRVGWEVVGEEAAPPHVHDVVRDLAGYRRVGRVEGGATLYHGTSRADLTHVLPAAQHGQETFTGLSSPDHAYATHDLTEAGKYADLSAMLTGQPRHVYEVRHLGPEHDLEPDPGYAPDVRSRHGFEVTRELASHEIPRSKFATIYLQQRAPARRSRNEIEQPLPQGNDLYYRFHHRDAPFGGQHAMSYGLHGDDLPQPGHSAFASPHDLNRYLHKMDWVDAPDEVDFQDRDVIAFRGRRVGSGLDGEPLVMPYASHPDHRMGWDEFQRRLPHTPGKANWDVGMARRAASDLDQYQRHAFGASHSQVLARIRDAVESQRAQAKRSARPTSSRLASISSLAFMPTQRLFGPTFGLDHRLFDGDQLKGDVRKYIYETLATFWKGKHGCDWDEWAIIYLAGSEASEWTSEERIGNNDFDVLIGVDYDKFRGYHSRREAKKTDQEITDELNADFKILNARTAEAYIPIDGRIEGPFSNTWYVNPDSYDIRKIKPYAAYDVTNMRWAVKPPHLPKWDISQFPEGPALVAECQAVSAYARAILNMPEPYRTQQGYALWHHLHSDRSRAFSGQGEGWYDPGNVIEKWLDQEGVWEQLVQIMVKVKEHPETMNAPQDWSNTPVVS